MRLPLRPAEQPRDGQHHERQDHRAAQLRQDFPNAGWRIRTSSEGSPGVQRWIDRIAMFLTLVGLTALLVGGVGVANAVRVPPVRDVEVAIPGLPPEFDGYRLLQLTDLHLSRLFPASWARAVVARANAAGADLIVVTGDTGFKGSWLSLWLTDLGAEVTGLSWAVYSLPGAPVLDKAATDALSEEAIAFYQVASRAFHNGELKQPAR